jgi:type IV pilus assembly protein PilO
MKPTFLSFVSGVIVLAFAWFFGYHNGIYLPNKAKLTKIREQLAQQEKLQALRREIADSYAAIEGFRQWLPKKPETEWLVREVGRLAEEDGVQLTSITQQNPRQVQDFTLLAVTLRCVATYHQLGKFISALENTLPMIRIDDLDIARSSQDTVQANLSLSSLHIP